MKIPNSLYNSRNCYLPPSRSNLCRRRRHQGRCLCRSGRGGHTSNLYNDDQNAQRDHPIVTIYNPIASLPQKSVFKVTRKMEIFSYDVLYIKRGYLIACYQHNISFQHFCLLCWLPTFRFLVNMSSWNLCKTVYLMR